jgi:hypothetical protein
MSETRVGLSSISEVMVTEEQEVIGEKPVPVLLPPLPRKPRMYYPRDGTRISTTRGRRLTE